DRKTFFQWADHLVAVSGGVEEFLVEQGVPSEKIERLYCGLDLRDVVAVAQVTTAEAKKRLGLPEDALTVGIAASLISRKGHRFLLEALKIMEGRGVKAHAIFAGEGDQEPALRAQVQALKLEDRVHFLGFRRDVHQVIAAMDVFTLPSEKEGLSIAVMEAMAIGKPVVATRISGMDEVVKDGENGLLVPPCNPPALAAALEALLTNPEKRIQFAKCGKSYVENNFEQSECVGRVEEFFTKIAEEGKLQPTSGQKVNSKPAAENPLRVVQIIAPSKIAGAERSTIALCRGLASRGNRLWLLVKDGQPMIGAAAKEGVDVAPMRIGGKLNPFAVGRLLRWIRRHRVDIVATQLSTASLWGSIAAKILGIPCVATVRALNTKTCYVLADRIIVVSEAVKKHLTDQGIAPEKIRVVYNGIDLQRFQPVPDLKAAKEKVGFKSDDLIVGVTAHLTRKKGHRSFLQAASLVSGQMPNVKFLLVGEGREREALEAQVKAAGLTGRVVFAGFQDDVLPWMAAMDILVLPTIEKEGFGRVLVEAGAMAKPVISTDIGGMAEVVSQGESGLVVRAGEVSELADAMLRLLSDESQRISMGNAGRARALARFSVDQMVANTEAVYREVWNERYGRRLGSGVQGEQLPRAV
ncbi:glycosyltransferase family 1 protein, partial [bacterium]